MCNKCSDDYKKLNKKQETLFSLLPTGIPCSANNYILVKNLMRAIPKACSFGKAILMATNPCFFS